MGDQNQVLFLRQRVPSVEGAVLEVGSKEYGSTSSFRDFYQGVEYIGVDREPGEGVDVVYDFVSSGGEFMASKPFALVICCSVMEHVSDPWLFAMNLSRVVRSGGKLYISVPWVWRYHAYPDDYWRFSWSGVKRLFPDFEWIEPIFSTNVVGEFFPAVAGAEDKIAGMAPSGRKYLPYLMLNMIGTRK